MSNKVANVDGGKTSKDGLTHFTSNLVAGNTIGTGWLVSQRGAGANMSVDVATGTGQIQSGSGYAYQAWSDAVNNVAITTADATNPRRDIIVAYIDTAVVSSASNDNPTALKFIAVAGTPAGSPSDPSGATIQSAVGASNPYIQLARVAVAASASSITNANVTDLRTTVTLNAESALSTSNVTLFSENTFDHVVSGIVITADSVGVNKNYSISSGVVMLSGKRLTVAAVSAQTVGASKDRYVDLHDNGDGTAVYVTTEVTNNATSPSLTAGNMRVGIVVAGATTIAATGSINQGEESKVLPIASSVPYAVTDSLGNLICPRDPNRKILGYRQVLINTTTTSATPVQITGLSVPVIVPTGRKVRVSLRARSVTGSATNSNNISIWSGVVNSGTQIKDFVSDPYIATANSGVSVDAVSTPSSANTTYNGGFTTNAGTLTLLATAASPTYLMVELV